MKIFFVFLILIFIFSSLHSLDYKWIGKDKVMHFSQSALLTYWNYGVYHNYFSIDKRNSKIFAASVTFSLGVSKEFSDKYIKKTFFSKEDLFYDFIGTVFGLILINNLR